MDKPNNIIEMLKNPKREEARGGREKMSARGNKQRLIDADALTKDVVTLAKIGKFVSYDKGNFNIGYNTALLHVKNLIESVHTIDAEPVKHGEWFVSEYEYLNCSVCGEAMYTACNSTKEAMVLKNHWKPFCPNLTIRKTR